MLFDILFLPIGNDEEVCYVHELLEVNVSAPEEEEEEVVISKFSFLAYEPKRLPTCQMSFCSSVSLKAFLK